MGEIMLTAETTHAEAQDMAVEAYADREAIVIGDERATFRELGERIDALAAGLWKLGLRKGDVVVMLLPTCIEFVYLYWAVGKTGAIIAPIEPLSREREVAHILADSEAKAVVFQPNVQGNNLLAILQKLRGDMPNLEHLIVRGGEAPEGMVALDSLMASGAPPPKGIPEPDDMWALFYTSGTTGLPKGVIQTHRTAMSAVVANAKFMEAMKGNPMAAVGSLAKLTLKYGTRFVRSAGKPGTWMVNSPIHLTAGNGPLRPTMFSGDRYLNPGHFHPVGVLETIEREKPTMMIAVPSMLRLMLDVKDFDRYDKSSLLTIVSGGTYVPPKIAKEARERFKCPVIIAYGSTEGGGIATTSITDGDKVATETVGTPSAGAEVRIVDDEHRTLPPGEVGEIAVRGTGIMAGYYKAPELTAEVLDDEGWYYTGDMGTMDEKGVYKIVGRKKDMIIRGGQNIYPPEIEEHINAHPAIQTSAVVGVPSQMTGEDVWAFVVLNEGQSVTPAEVLRYCRKGLAAFKVPSEVRIVEELPMAGRLKVQKYKLRNRAIQELRDAGEEVVEAESVVAGPVGA
jgi:acyl-CoA synthetase (AMP-forming)/AMP-acid ligase II